MRYIILELKSGKDAKAVASEMEVSQRRIQQLWAEYKKTGKCPGRGRIRRLKKADPSDADIEMVLDIHRRRPDGVQLTARRLRRSRSGIRDSKVYPILTSN